jgi:hypothetical protein
MEVELGWFGNRQPPPSTGDGFEPIGAGFPCVS